jgi:hypothetical protein
MSLIPSLGKTFRHSEVHVFVLMFYIAEVSLCGVSIFRGSSKVTMKNFLSSVDLPQAHVRA